MADILLSIVFNAKIKRIKLKYCRHKRFGIFEKIYTGEGGRKIV